MKIISVIFWGVLAKMATPAAATALRGSELENQEHRNLATNNQEHRNLGLGDWAFCSTSSECNNGCCSSKYSNDGKLKCTPLSGGFDANICVTSSSTGKLGDWAFCSTSSQCQNGCCSSKYSNDGKLKCTPGGFNSAHCVTSTASTPSKTCGNGNRGDGACIDGTCCSQFGWCGTTAAHCGTTVGPGTTVGITAPGKTLTIADVQAGLNRYNALQGGSATASQDIVNQINKATAGYSLYRQIALIATTIWESGGFKYTEEIAAVTPPFATKGNYQICKNGQPATNGQFFYGRGYIQLSHCSNYQAFGEAMKVNNDPNYFYNNPGAVATTYAMETAKWYFDSSVPDTSGRFGLITKSVNGPLECFPSNNFSGSAPQKRYQIFVALASQVGLTGYAESGCYN